MSGAGVAPPPGCEGTPPSGVFALHGRPVDVLSDGLGLTFTLRNPGRPKKPSEKGGNE